MSGVQEVKLNEPSTFQCIIESNPEATVKWFKNDQEISAFPKTVPINNITMVRKDETFKIQSAQPDDMAIYKCEATNEVLGVKRKVVQSIDFKVRCMCSFLSTFSWSSFVPLLLTLSLAGLSI